MVILNGRRRRGFAVISGKWRRWKVQPLFERKKNRGKMEFYGKWSGIFRNIGIFGEFIFFLCVHVCTVMSVCYIREYIFLFIFTVFDYLSGYEVLESVLLTIISMHNPAYRTQRNESLIIIYSNNSQSLQNPSTLWENSSPSKQFHLYSCMTSKKKTKQCQFVQITMKLNGTDKQVNNLEREYNH